MQSPKPCQRQPDSDPAPDLERLELKPEPDHEPLLILHMYIFTHVKIYTVNIY